jgi:hypothetical protein
MGLLTVLRMRVPDWSAEMAADNPQRSPSVF